VVDDEASILDLFSQIIAKQLPNARVDTAVNGQQAVDMCKDSDYKVIIMDVIMPVMNGEFAFEAIQQNCKENHRTMPSVVFCTGCDDDPSHNFLSLGNSDERHCVIYKPVRNETIMSVIKQRLAV